MISDRRVFLRMSAIAAGLPVVARRAWALDYPTRPVHILVGFPPGTVPDIIARLIAQWLSEKLGQQFIVENRPGAGSVLAAEAVARAPADGYTLLLTAPPNMIVGPLIQKLTFNLVRDIAPVASLVENPFVMEVAPTFPAKTVPEFIAYAKAHPGEINVANTATGNLDQLASDLFKMMTGVDMLDVPYGGEVQAQAEMLSGRAHLMFDPVLAAIGYIKAGTLRPIAVTTTARLDVMPDVPTVAETLPGYEVTGTLGLSAPKETPVDIVEMLNQQVNAGLNDPQIKTRLRDLGSLPVAMSSAGFGTFIVSESEKWGKVVQSMITKAH